ncbi:MAG: tetratricopeptide repeat protein [Spirochaetia bacterium]|nr:tetratricopeptide repeat protein [Spirochaetia bacterium]
MINIEKNRKSQARNAFFEQALREEKNKDFKKALHMYKLSLKIDINFFDSWLNSGAIYSRMGKNNKAITCYKKAASIKKDKRAYYNLAVEFFRVDKFKETEENLMESLKQDDSFFQAYLLLGYSYGKTGEHEKSEEAIKKALKINPQSKPALTALSLLYYHTNRYNLSLKYVERLLKNSPEDSVLQKLYGKLNLENGNLTESIEAFKKSAENDTTIKKLYETLEKEQTERQKQKIIVKKRFYEKKSQKTSKDWLDLSLLTFFSGEPSKAMEYLSRAQQSKMLNKSLN